MTNQLNRFFVYGTLRPGELRWQVLEPYLECPPESAQLHGVALYTNRIYPFIIASNDERDSVVVGELITIRPEVLEQVIDRLDMIEGYSPYEDHEENLFNRLIGYTTSLATESIVNEAWVYFGGHDLQSSIRTGRYERIESGDWKDR